MITEIVKFTDNAEEEIQALLRELRLGKLIEQLSPQATIPEEFKTDLRQLMLTLVDLFGTDLPSIDSDPMETLRLASRDINLGRILKERGLFRIYRMLSTCLEMVDTDPTTGEQHLIEKPMYQTVSHPETGVPFARREEIITWFCQAAKVSRATVFSRLATIERLLALDFTEEEAYRTILAKPYAIRETLEVATWNKDELVSIRPEIANRLADRMLLPGEAASVHQWTDLISQSDADPDEQAEVRQNLSLVLKPALAQLVREVASHESVRDAMDFVRYDIAGEPELKYRWDYEREELAIELTRKAIDPKGTEYITDVLKLRLIPDPLLPPEVRNDLITRLPVTNREILR